MLAVQKYLIRDVVGMPEHKFMLKSWTFYHQSPTNHQTTQN